jgi:hypothetical protein
VLTQICAEALQLPVERVAIASPDTDGSPYNWGTTASRVTYVAGRSVVGAAAEIERQLKRHASEMLECSVDDLELLPGGKVAIKGVAQKAVSFADISGRAHWATGGPLIGTHSWVFDEKTFDPKRAAPSACRSRRSASSASTPSSVEVELDEATGQVRVVGAWSACDVGRAINPAMASGQIEGAFVQGMGYALVEEMVLGRRAPRQPEPHGLQDPDHGRAAGDAARPTSSSRRSPSGPFGAKSVGELGINGVAAAIANAVGRCQPASACGRLPMTGERGPARLLETTPRAMKLADYPPQSRSRRSARRTRNASWRAAPASRGASSRTEAIPTRRLLVYPAPRATGDVLVFFHGGGWTSGYKEWMAFMAPALQARGVTFVTPGYRSRRSTSFRRRRRRCRRARLGARPRR